jgi:hypothetical protein
MNNCFVSAKVTADEILLVRKKALSYRREVAWVHFVW